MMKKYFIFSFMLIFLLAFSHPDIVTSQHRKSTSSQDAEYVAKAKEAFRQKDLNRGIAILKQGADQGFKECAYLFADAAKIGKEYKLAYKYFLQAALAGHLVAQLELSLLYGEGKGVKKDLGKMSFWIGTAAKSGYLPAIEVCRKQYIDYEQDRYGLTTRNLIYQGYQKPKLETGSTQSSKQPFDTPSETELSAQAKSAMRRGDYQQAVTLLTKGIEAGYASCAHDLGMIRYLGGTYSIAYDLFLQAALIGYKESQYMLSTLYRDGKGVPKNTVKSSFWLGTSAKSGYDGAIKSCEEKGINYRSSRYGLTTTNLRQHGYK